MSASYAPTLIASCGAKLPALRCPADKIPPSTPLSSPFLYPSLSYPPLLHAIHHEMSRGGGRGAGRYGKCVGGEGLWRFRSVALMIHGSERQDTLAAKWRRIYKRRWPLSSEKWSIKKQNCTWRPCLAGKTKVGVEGEVIAGSWKRSYEWKEWMSAVDALCHCLCVQIQFSFSCLSFFTGWHEFCGSMSEVDIYIRLPTPPYPTNDYIEVR